MGISTGQFSRPAKFSTIVADADLDIGARAILTTNLSLYEGDANNWWMRNRAKSGYKRLQLDYLTILQSFWSNILSENTVNSGVTIDGMLIKDDKIREFDGIGGNVMEKEVSANERIAHDAEQSHATAMDVYTLAKTITFTHGIKGNVRFKWQLKASDANFVRSKIYKNGVALGTAQSVSGVAWSDETEDLNIGTVDAGETLELWTCSATGTNTAYCQLFKLCFDDINGVPDSANT